MKDNYLIKTKRLNVYPLSDIEIENMIKDCKDEGLSLAYKEMLDGSINDPENRVWYVPWVMETLDEKKKIGTLGFRGPATNNSVEIGYGINKEYEGLGYTSEALESLIDWAFDNEDVLFIEAEADENNKASIHILEKNEFTEYKKGEEGPRFVKVKPEHSFTSIDMSIGMCLGLSFGMLVFDNMVMGMCIGMCLGLIFGASKDEKEKNRILEIKKERYGI